MKRWLINGQLFLLRRDMGGWWVRMLNDYEHHWFAYIVDARKWAEQKANGEAA